MRAAAAQATDLVILSRPTMASCHSDEAIRHAKAANVPIVVR